MPAPPTRLDSAESAAEHVAWARWCGMSPRECARAIGWTVPHDAPWGMVAALYVREHGNLVDRGARQWCHETAKAGGGNLRLAARGEFPRVSSAGATASDFDSHRVKDCTLMPVGQGSAAYRGAYSGHTVAGGGTRSKWRSGF